MKKQRYSILTLMMLTLFCGCTTGVDELFDKTASERHDDHMTECKTLLVSATNGWLIEYYPDGDQHYGGFNYIAKFDKNGTTVVRGENTLSDEKTSSHYSILSSNGVVLSLDTYNVLFHYYSDPDYGGGDSYGGDFEFTFVSGDANEMIFKGTRTGNIIRFTALADGVDWDVYMKKVEEMRRMTIVSPYSLFIWEGGSGQLELVLDDDLNKFSYIPDSSDPYLTESVPFCYTPTGIKLYESIEIGQITVQTFDWDNATQSFISVGAKNATETEVKVSLLAKQSVDYIPFEKYLGDWKLSYGQGNESEDVKIVLADRYKSEMLMTGLLFDIKLKYSKITGKLKMDHQLLGDMFGLYIYLCVWDTNEGSLTWKPKTGFNLAYNKDDANPKIAISDNSVWEDNIATGMLFYVFEGLGALGPAFSLAQYPNLSHLHK